MAEVDFEKASADQIIDAFFTDGSVLLRNFVRPDALRTLIAFVGELYEDIDAVHIFARNLRERGLPDFHDCLFADKHHQILEKIFGPGQYAVNENTATRRVHTARRGDGRWQPPLGPHLDAFYHQFAFTVNFWVPFRACGIDALSLGVVRSPFAEAAARSGYDGGSEPQGSDRLWNFARFSPEMFDLARRAGAAKVEWLREAYPDRVWTPVYRLGDAMMLSNWTFHFTHTAAGMDHRRSNVELRFSSGQSLGEIVKRHAARAANSVL